MFGSPTADRFGAQRACRRVSRMPAAAPRVFLVRAGYGANMPKQPRSRWAIPLVVLTALWGLVLIVMTAFLIAMSLNGQPVNPAPEPTASPTGSNPAPTSPPSMQTDTLPAAPDPSISAEPEAFGAPEKLDGEVARITYLGNTAVAEQGAAPDPKRDYQMRASCVGEGSITPELWVNGVKAVDGATWGCSIELPAAVNVDSAMPRLQSSDEVQIRFKELWSNQEAWAVLEPAYPSEE